MPRRLQPGWRRPPSSRSCSRRRRHRTVLDIGCGEGSFLLQLAQKLGSTRFVGVDHSELAIADARRKLRRRALRNVDFRTAFFDRHFDCTTYDAVTTRYTLQHSSEPGAFVKAVFDRLNTKGSFVSVESLDAVHGQPRAGSSVGAISDRRGGGPPESGQQRQSRQVARLAAQKRGLPGHPGRVVLCSPSTIGTGEVPGGRPRHQRTWHSDLFPDLLDQRLHHDLEVWLADRKRLEERDPYICSAIANGTKR